MLRKLLQHIIGDMPCLLHGGDWGAIIGSWMAFDAPDRIAAQYINAAPLRRPFEMAALDAREQAYLTARNKRLSGELAIRRSSRPNRKTLAYGLTDSPVGLAGWMLEKYQGWVVPGSGDPPFAMDALLTIILIYWLNGINAANWLYGDLADAVVLWPGERVKVPTALVTGGRDLGPPPPPQWVRRSYDLVEMRHVPYMGHFPAIEPIAMTQVQHMRDFFRPYR